MIRHLRARLSTADLLSIANFSSLLLIYLIFEKNELTYLVASGILALAVVISVRHADVIADRIGLALGTIVLALSVTVIEVALIISLMANHTANSPTIARDTVFSAVMIVTNGIIGICILLGGIRQKELNFQALGTTALLGVLAVLSILTLVLPNFTTTTHGPTYDTKQLIFVSIVAVALYGALVWAQTKTHKSFFEQTANEQGQTAHKNHLSPSKPRAWLSFFGLLLSLITVIGLAKFLSPAIEQSILSVGAPGTVVGIIVALLILAPETIAAVKAARTNDLQTSLNLALGSGAASIALTIPCVSLYSIFSGNGLSLGLDNKGIVFLLMTFMAASFTFGSGRTIALHGIVHLTIMAAYVALSFFP
jgi:Ca2+:H+ antiporter